MALHIYLTRLAHNALYRGRGDTFPTLTGVQKENDTFNKLPGL